MDQRVLFHAPPPPHRTSGAGRTPADGRAHSTCRYTYQSIANCETPAVRRCAAVAASAWVRAWECATQNCLNSDIYANFDRDCRCGFSFVTEGTLGLSGEIHNDKRLLGGSEVGGEDKNEQKALQRGATGPLEQTAPRFVSVFVTLPWEGGCSFAMGRSSLRLSPLLAHGHTPGRAMAGGRGTSGRVARRMALQVASTTGGEHVRWALARHSNWPPPLRLQRCRSHTNRPVALPG